MRTVAELWRRAVSEGRSYPAYLVQENESWRAVAWDEAGRAVDELAASLLELGIAKGDRVALLGRTRLEWTLCDYALVSIGAIVVPIYPTSSARECAYILGNSEARAVVCEDSEQYAKVASSRSELPGLEHVVAIEGPHGSAVRLDELRERGRARLGADPVAVDEARARVAEEDVMTIIYTSGTTGPPKGCVLAQRNYWVMADMVGRVEGLFASGDRVLLYLPLAHTFARLVEFLGAGVGFTIAFCPDVAALGQALLDIRPTLLPSAPRVFEKLHAAVRANIDAAPGPRRRLAAWALAVGRRASRYRQAGKPLPPALALQFLLADRLVFSKTKARLGGRLRYGISGGAPLATEVAEFFAALDIVILEGYGLTECTTASHVNRPGRYRFGTVGPALPGVEARIAADGEVLIRGENVFQGYYRGEEATRQALTEDGWLMSGDVGSIDADGFLTITDRKKDIIVTSGGKNVSPQNIEGALKASKYVSQALVTGDGRPYITALITLNPEEVAGVATTEEEARVLIERVVADVNRDLGRVEQIKRFAILPRDFLPEEGEVTPTLKLRRRVCEEHFRVQIEKLYAAPTPAELTAGRRPGV